MKRILLHCALCRNRKKNPDQRTIYSSSVQYVFKGHVIHTSSIFRKTSFSRFTCPSYLVFPYLPKFLGLKTNELWLRVRSKFEFQVGHSNRNTTFTLLVCIWFLKNRVWKIKLDELDFWSISKFNFAGYTGSKINCLKPKFVQHDFSNSIF